MQVEISNLFNQKKVIISREDILKIVLYAIKNNIVDITFDCPIDKVECNGIYESVNIVDINYNIELREIDESSN